MRRRGPAPSRDLRALVHAGFAHRRKALPGSLALTPGARPELRDAARQALERLGRPPDARAEQLAPEEWALLAERIGPELLAELRPRT
jgi:16S rRNA A1518/A1519 N6-dimethyltransferase RsmA/KsgA/DIM1 with predicted DNA glycosylase/AP lyase activity